MYTAKLENSRGNIITLTGNEAEYQVISIKGLNPPSAHLNTSTVSGMDGAMFNSSRLNTRNIVITMKINGDVEANRQKLETFCPTKERVRFYFSNNNRNVYVDGYVNSVECDLFTNDEMMQISIICPQPYFLDTSNTKVNGSSISSCFVFPFSIDVGYPIPISEIVMNNSIMLHNDSVNEIGMIIDIDVEADVNSILIRNTDTGESFTLSYDFEEGDHIAINTLKGQKSIILTRNGVRSNIFTAMQIGSVFFQLAAGDNYFSYIVDGDASNNTNVDIIFTFYKMYRGV